MLTIKRVTFSFLGKLWELVEEKMPSSTKLIIMNQMFYQEGIV